MNDQLNYNLLRPFDLDAAKRGEGVMWGKDLVRWVALSDDNNLSIIEHSVGLSYATKGELKMAPLCWVEGRPVYEGDTLYFKEGTICCGESFVVKYSGPMMAFSVSGRFSSLDNLTWDEPNPILCEVQGKPVRKGDRLWSKYFKDWFVVTGRTVVLNEVSLRNERGGDTLITSCSWKREVTKRGWVNIYEASSYREANIAVADVAPVVYCDKSLADEYADSNRIACVYVEWEEEVN